MTEAEAINILQLNTPFVASKEANKAVEMAINALEKQIAKKIISPLKIENVIGGYCPTCNGTIRFAETWLVKTKGQHCSWCGQKLDWSEV